MEYLPVFLDVKNRPCLVVGVGAVADEKARALEKAGAMVRRAETFEPEANPDVFLIMAATEDLAIARAVREFGERHRIFVNVVDKTEFCSFIVPAIVDRGNLLIAISSSGKSPAIASAIRRQLEQRYGPEYSAVIELLGQIRPQVRARLPRFEDRKAFYLQLVARDLPEIHRRGGGQAVQALIESKLEEI